MPRRGSRSRARLRLIWTRRATGGASACRTRPGSRGSAAGRPRPRSRGWNPLRKLAVGALHFVVGRARRHAQGPKWIAAEGHRPEIRISRGCQSGRRPHRASLILHRARRELKTAATAARHRPDAPWECDDRPMMSVDVASAAAGHRHARLHGPMPMVVRSCPPPSSILMARPVAGRRARRRPRYSELAPTAESRCPAGYPGLLC